LGEIRENGFNELRKFLGLPQISRELSRATLFPQFEEFLSGGNRLTELQKSLLRGFIGFKN
jgi:hypothetical protein